MQCSLHSWHAPCSTHLWAVHPRQRRFPVSSSDDGPAGQQLNQQQPQAVDVGGQRAALAQQLLGGCRWAAGRGEGGTAGPVAGRLRQAAPGCTSILNRWEAWPDRPQAAPRSVHAAQPVPKWPPAPPTHPRPPAYRLLPPAAVRALPASTCATPKSESAARQPWDSSTLADLQRRRAAVRGTLSWDRPIM